MTPPDPHAVARLTRLTGITRDLLEGQAARCGLSVEELAASHENLAYASVGRDTSAWAAFQMLENAKADLDLQHRARRDPDGGFNKDFLDFTSKEGAERRKVYFAAGVSARQNVAEARQSFLHASVLTQHIPAEESARAKDANLPGTPESSLLTGPAAQISQQLANPKITKHAKTAARKEVEKLGEELVATAAAVESSEAAA